MGKRLAQNPEPSLRKLRMGMGLAEEDGTNGIEIAT
jgi:hypothetical protein